MILKEQLQSAMKRKIENLESDFALKMENLKGETNEVEKQKAILIEKRDTELATLKQEMEGKISELMEQIRKHNEIESELIVENNLLKEKLLKEREEFLSELNRESSLKQDMLNKLEAKMKQQEEIQLKEKLEFESLLQKETEQLRLAKEKMLNKLNEAQQKAEKSIEILKSRVVEREIELSVLAAERIQQQAEQSSEVISSLQEQLERVRSQLQSVESENLKLVQTSDKNKEGASNSTLAEFGEIVESELQCSICAELFVSAITLNCSHTFCKYCITMWKKKKKACPICRAAIYSECKSLVLDSFIEKMVQNLTEEMKQKRKNVLRSREDEVIRMNSKTAASYSTTRGNTRTTRTYTRGTRNTRGSRNTRGTRNTNNPAGVGLITGLGVRPAQIPTVDLTTLMMPPVQAPDQIILQELVPDEVMTVEEDIEVGYQVSPAPTTAATGAVSAAARAVTGPPAAHYATYATPNNNHNVNWIFMNNHYYDY